MSRSTRAEALDLAMKHWGGTGVKSEQIVATAKEFEEYLASEA